MGGRVSSSAAFRVREVLRGGGRGALELVLSCGTSLNDGAVDSSCGVLHAAGLPYRAKPALSASGFTGDADAVEWHEIEDAVAVDPFRSAFCPA